jgi:hypothetical protein
MIVLLLLLTAVSGKNNYLLGRGRGSVSCDGPGWIITRFHPNSRFAAYARSGCWIFGFLSGNG